MKGLRKWIRSQEEIVEETEYSKETGTPLDH